LHFWAAWHSAWSQVAPEYFAPLDVTAFVERGDLPLNSVGRHKYRVAQETIKAFVLGPNHWENCRHEGWAFDLQLSESEQTEADLVGDAQSDQLLVKRCLAGEVAAWEELYSRFHRPLCTAIRGMLGPGGSDLSRVVVIAARVWYALVRNDGELLNRFDPVQHTRLVGFLRGLAGIEITQYLRAEHRRRTRESG
jgi:hypothetical protein